MSERQTLTAYLATLSAIVILCLSAALVCVAVKAETHLAQIVAALGFISAAMTGLIGVLGTFKPRTTMPDQPQPVQVANGPSDPVPVEAAS